MIDQNDSHPRLPAPKTKHAPDVEDMAKGSAPDQLEVKSLASLKDITIRESDTSAPRFSGLAAIYNSVDRDGDVLLPGVFGASLKAGSYPRLLWQHDPTSPLGRFTHIEDRPNGLYVEAELATSGRAREAYDLLKLKALDGLSVGFVTKEASRDAVTGVRHIARADLAEISLVTFPANEGARVETVKSRSALKVTHSRPEFLSNKTSFERFLRDSGVSRGDAKAIVAKGLAAIPGYEELEHDLRAMVNQLRDAAKAIRNQ